MKYGTGDQPMAIKTRKTQPEPKPNDPIVRRVTNAEFDEWWFNQVSGHSGKWFTPTRTGRPPSGKKVVSIRLDPDVIEKFKATGPGWQARINDALRRAVI
jgi:uncharacterized protein (DUF4415 family)